MTAKEELRDKIISEAEKGNVCFYTIEGIMCTEMDNLLKQPIEGILYDINRLPEVIMTFIDDPKWVNDYAFYLIFKKIFTERASLLARIKELEGDNEAMRKVVEAAKNIHLDWDDEDVSAEEAFVTAMQEYELSQ